MAGTWEVSNPTTSKSGVTTRKATYKVDGKVVATLAGLNENVSASGGSISGITVTEATSGGIGTINLTGAVLTNSNVTLSVAKGSKYQLGLVDGGYQKVTPTDVTPTVTNGTITFNGKLTQGYTLKNATTVTYSAATDKTKTVKFLTLTGLNTNLGVVDGKIGTTTTTGEGDNKVTTLDEELVLLDATTGVVTLKAGALAGGNANLKIDNSYSPYKTFALDSSVAAPELGNGTWVDKENRNGVFTGVSTYTANVTAAGYTLSLDNKNVTYTAVGTDKGLVTVSGLADSNGIKFKTDDSSGEDVLDARNNRTIVLPASTLAQKAVTVSGAGFLLGLDDDVNESDVANTNIWVPSGANATYKTVKPEYYTYDAASNKINYTKQADVKTLATVKNLAGGFTVGTDEDTGNSALYKGDPAVATVTVDNSGVITLAADALTNKNVTLTNGTGENYKLALKDVTAPGVDNDTAKTWKVKGTTATLSGKTTEGWANTSDTLITYVKGGQTIALATVNGLKSGVKENTEKNAVGVKDSSGTIVNGLALDGNNDNEIIVSANVLGATNVKLTPAAGYTYKLVLDDGDAVNGYSLAGGAVPLSGNTKHFWYLKGKALLLKKGTARFYDLTNDTNITQHDEVVGEEVALVTGLKTGLKVVDGSIDGITVSGKKITVSKDVLNKADVSFTSNKGGYSLALASDTLKPDVNGKMWIVNGTTAALAACVSEGYTPNSASNSTVLKYSKTNPGNILATVTGLKSGLKVVDDKIDGIKIGTYDNDNDGVVDVDDDDNPIFTETNKGTFIQLAKKVTGTTDITLNNTGGKDYQLSLDGTTIKPLTEANLTKTWRVGSGKTAGTAYYDVKAAVAGFEEVEKDNKVVQLAYKKNTTVTTTISGLADDISASEGAITGITGPDENGVIKLSKNVLGGKNATLKNASGGTYTLALNTSDADETKNVGAPVASEFTWVPDFKTKTTAYLKGVVGTPGYELSEDALSVVYTPASGKDADDNDVPSTLATVTGLKSGLTADELKDGITRNGSVLTLGDSVLGGTKLTVKGGTYTLAIANEDSTKAIELTNWVTSGTTANFKTYLTGYYTPDAKGTTVKYTAPTKGTTYATVKGIAKNVNINGGYTATSDTAPAKGGTLELTSDMLAASNVTLTGSGFSLALASSVPTSAENVTEWVTSGTTATYKKYDKAYYTRSGNTVKYTKPTGGTTYATIKGIASGATIAPSNISTAPSGNTIITLNADQLAKKKVTISGSGYELALGNDTDKATSLGTYWTQANKAVSAIYKEDFSPGYTLANAKNAITYSANPTTTTLATVGGLVTNTAAAITTRTESTDPETGATTFVYNNVFNDWFTVDDETHTITLTDYKAFGTRSGDDPKNGAKITLTDNAGKGYSLAIDGSSVEAPAAVDNSLGWKIDNRSKNPTAKYTEDYTEGVNVSDDKKTLTYAAEITDKALATISGLNKAKLNSLKNDDDTPIVWTEVYEPTDDAELAEKFGIQVSGTTIKLLNDNMLGTGKVTLGKNDLFAFDVSAIAPSAGSDKWAVKGTTAIYSNTTAAGYKTTDTKTVAYVKEVVGDPIVTLTGLKKNLKAVNGEIGGISVVPDMHIITLNSSVLGTTNINLSDNGGQGYKIYSVGGNTPHESKSWTYSGTTATYKNIQTGGYTLAGDGLSVAYTAPKTTTLATVKGLVKNFTGDLDDALRVGDNTITVGKDIITTGKVTLTLPKNGDPYSLAIGSGINQNNNISATKWVTSGTNANFKTYNEAYYTLDASSSAIIYNKPTAGTTYATIKGIKSGVDINAASAVTDGTVGGTITLTAAMLGTSKVIVANAKGNTSATYTLALANDVSTSPAKATGWVIEKTNAYYRKNYDKATYKLENNAITYTKGANMKGEEIATIKGASGDITSGLGTNSATSSTFMLTNEGLSNKISLATQAEESVSKYAFNFNDTYNNSAITGSGNKDTITAQGDRLTITGGKGDDEITLGTGDRVGNNIVYSNGDGNDVIANFQEGDTITVKSLTPTVEFKDPVEPNDNKWDVEITFNKTGKITLKDSELTSVTINGKIYEKESVASNVLLADDNYSMNAASLSDIVNPVAASFTPYDFSSNFSLTKEDKLTPQISYSGNDK